MPKSQGALLARVWLTDTIDISTTTPTSFFQLVAPCNSPEYGHREAPQSLGRDVDVLMPPPLMPKIGVNEENEPHNYSSHAGYFLSCQIQQFQIQTTRDSVHDALP